MTQSQLAYQAQAGDFLRHYKPPTNIHTLVNAFVPPNIAFLPFPTADITTVVQFPDVSFYQGEIDFDEMVKHTNAIILRAGQNVWEDIQFKRNYDEAKRVGMLVGIYWFYDDRASPGAQADKLREVLGDRKLDLEIFIDWENSYGGQFKGLPNVVAMMQRVESFHLPAKDVGLYTGYYFFRANSNPIAHASQYAYLKNKPLWEAWYTNNPANVLIPTPWTSLTHWQWGTPAVEWGQKSREIDMNFYNGTQQEFDSRYTNQGGTMPYYELRPNVAGEYRSIRAQTNYPTTPHILGARIGQIDPNSSAKAGEFDFYTYQSDVVVSGVLRAKAGDVWWKVYESNGTTISGWVSEIHLGQRYLNKELIGGSVIKVHQIDVYSDGKISIDGGPAF